MPSAAHGGELLGNFTTMCANNPEFCTSAHEPKNEKRNRNDFRDEPSARLIGIEFSESNLSGFEGVSTPIRGKWTFHAGEKKLPFRTSTVPGTPKQETEGYVFQAVRQW